MKLNFAAIALAVAVGGAVCAPTTPPVTITGPDGTYTIRLADIPPGPTSPGDSAIVAASCSQASVAAAVALAAPGSAVRVPAGTCSWSSGISLSGVQLIGAGSSTSGTVITAGMVTMTKHATAYTRLSGFRFTGGDQHLTVGGSASAKPYIVDNNYFNANVSSLALQIKANGGVVHHNQLIATSPTNGDMFNVPTSEDWSQAPTLGTNDTTGERNIYFEDNTISGVLETGPDGDQGSRLVIRHNTYTDSSIVFHGGSPQDSSAGGGTRQFEVYSNTFVRVSNSVAVNKWIWVRGSTGVIANNIMPRADSPDGSSYPNKSEIRLTLGCPSAYPMQYQVGQSTSTPTTPPTLPLLIFGNTGAGTLDTDFITVGSSDTGGGANVCATPANYIQAGRDYKLTNAWGWTPYAYPHPLQTLATSGSGPVMAMPPATQFEVNGGALMRPRTGFSTLRVRPTTITTGVPGGTAGAFRITCAASHQLFDDPIVYPGQPGKSHLHTFFGNSDVNGTLTAATLGSLATFGRTTCAGGVGVNSSGYWVPAVINTVTGFPVVPSTNLAYYKAHYSYGGENLNPPFPVSAITVPVPGLRMIAGTPTNTSATGNGAYDWACIRPDGTQSVEYSMPGAACVNGSYIMMRIYFPECWDGVNLDSPNHQSHMAYASTTAGCPATHPVPIPAISFNIRYEVNATHRPENWRLASDTYSTSIPAGRSAHGDWINGWNQTALTGIVNNCIKAARDCHANLDGLGNIFY